MFEKIQKYSSKPELYAPSTGAFWDDEHISKQMLANHLNPDADGASRTHEFIHRSAKWIKQTAPPVSYPKLLDLGCGPGLYARWFAEMGYEVTAVDYSKRSIAFAKEQDSAGNISYHYENYLTMDRVEEFNVITLIYCDYGALSVEDRGILLRNVYRALKKNGLFILDVFTPKMRGKEGKNWAIYPEGGFFSPQPHLCLDSVYQYDDADETELRQNIIVTEQDIHCYNLWDHFFTGEKLVSELKQSGFAEYQLYGDVAGKIYDAEGETICGVSKK